VTGGTGRFSPRDGVAVGWAVVRALVLFVLWQTVAVFPLVLGAPPLLAAGWLAAVALLFVRMYAVPGWLSGRMVARGRPRPVGWSAGWLWKLVPVMMVLPLALTAFFLALELVQPEEFPEWLRRYTERPWGGVPLLLLIVGMAPLLEEFAFRGWMQRPLERRLGAGVAIGLTSIVFALMHLQPSGLPIRMIAGAILGYVVWITGSIWAGVLLHAVWNGGVILLGGIFVAADPTGRGWAWGAPALAVIALCLGAFGWLARGMAEEARARAPEGRQGAVARTP
jgi:uncharacterized protein